MSQPTPMNEMPSEPGLESMAEELLAAQLALGDSITSVSQFLRTVMTIVNANLSVIQTQLVRIQELALAIENGNQTDSGER